MAEKLSAEQAAERVRRTDSIGMPLATGQPPTVLAALGQRTDWQELRVYGALLSVNSPAAIRANRKMVSINGAIAVDIQGQVVADTIDGRQLSGIGGHEDFVTGPALGSDDRALLCLASTVEIDGERRSRIVPWFEAGAVITTPRHQVDVIVTEYGAAELAGKTIHQRGQELARIAHPDFRDELFEAARRASGGNAPFPR